MPITDRDIDSHSVADEQEQQGGDLAITDERRAKREEIIKKRTTQGLKEKWAAQDRMEVEARAKALAPPAMVVPQCLVCTHPQRAWIDMMLVKGEPYVRLAEHIPENKDGRKPDRRSLARHFKEHMEIDKQRIRAELESEAELIGQSVDSSVQGAITERGILRVAMRKAFDDILNGVSTVEPKDMIQIAKILKDWDVESSSARAEENEIALRTFVRAIEIVLGGDPDTIGKIVREAERIREQDDVTFAMEGILVRGEPVPTQPLELEMGIIDGDDVR